MQSNTNTMCNKCNPCKLKKTVDFGFAKHNVLQIKYLYKNLGSLLLCHE